MPKGLTYADAVMLLGGASPAVAAFDKVLGGLLTATVGVPGVLSLFDAKSEAVRVGHLLTTEVRQRVHGAARLDRTQRLQAAHSVLVVTALFDAFDDLDLPFTLRDVSLTRGEQARLAGGPPGDAWLPGLLQAAVPAPGPAMPFAAFRQELREWYAGQARRLPEFISGLAVLDRLNETQWALAVTALREQLPETATRRFEEAYLRLAAEIPEFALWVWRADADAKDTALDQISAGLRGLETVLRSIGSSLSPGEQCLTLAGAYRADLDQPVAGDEQDTGDCAIPSLAESYLDPRFTVRMGGPSDNPADEFWWDGTEARDDLAVFLAGHLTATAAAKAPLVVLGQPGSGKSALTRVLAARLPAEDFLTVRVPLREVPADADLQDQIEHAVRIATGEQVSWPDLARSASGGLRVVLLDGFDELLQATGVSQSDYLMKVAKFQRREASLQRPVAVVVTSRTAVANRASLPEGSTIVRLEPFDDRQIQAWLDGWNRANAATFERRDLRPLDAEVVGRHEDLARQPLLLLMLALYDAQDNAVRSAGGTRQLSRVHLYEGLLTSFADREIHKDHSGPLPAERRAAAVERELLQLSVVAFAMANRDRQWVTAEELDADLTALGLTPPALAHHGFAATQTSGEQVVGRFFFVQRAQALQDTRRLHTYEFLHATFAEFLVARLIVRILADLTARAAAGLLALRPPPPHDDLAYALLSFAPLTGQGSATLTFTRELLADERRQPMYDWLLRAFHHATTRLDVPTDAYLPAAIPAGQRLVRYGLNLVLLAIATHETVAASELFPIDPDPAERLGRAAHGWQATLGREQWEALLDILTAVRSWSGTTREVRLKLRPILKRAVDPVDIYWLHGFRPGSEVWNFDPGSGFNGYASNVRTQRAHQLRANLGEDLFRHALEPLLAGLDAALTTFVVHGPQDAESIARSLLQAWLVSAQSGLDGSLERAYERLVAAATGRGWGHGQHADGRLTIALVLEMLTRDVHRLPRTRLSTWLLSVASCDQCDLTHLPAILNCVALAGGGDEFAPLLDRIDLVPLDSASEHWTSRDQLILEICRSELEGQPFRAQLHPATIAEVLRHDRALTERYQAMVERRSREAEAGD